MKLRTTLRANDTPQLRAEKIVAMLGLSGDPKIIAQHRDVIADLLAVYQEIDGRYYDSAVDSYRSYYAAIEAIRRQKFPDADGDR